jgi:isopentenyl diphosphate isomerase/L-lactate dehydrogenase-like FMN-dependent dehydrogenase
MKLDRAVTIDDLRTMARKRLPRPAFDIVEGGAGDEISLARNRAGFDRIAFRPRPFVDIRDLSVSTEFFGKSMPLPVGLAPTGASRIVRSKAELSVARAAKSTGALYIQSTVTGVSYEEVARNAGDPIWFQLYLPRTREETAILLKNVAKSGYSALVITVDTATSGNRERDRRNGVVVPAHLTARLALEAAKKPAWVADVIVGNIKNLEFRRRYINGGALPASVTSRQILRAAYPVLWEDVDFVREVWTGPVLIKGIMRSDECDQLIDHGIDGFIVSNHGGRQLDGVPATIDVLPEIVRVVAGRVPVFLDGGVRRGTDVVKAIALGAAGVFIGRPYLYGLAAGGERGIERVLEIFTEEIHRTLALLGCRSIADIDDSLVSILPAL